MLKNPRTKYRPFPPIALPERSWPDAVLTKAPIWLSTDLRDGNQALIEPMDIARKLQMFDELVRIGFKEIEVGFPASSQIEFDFLRRLIEERRIPDDVTIQVMTPARPELIARTVESLDGARHAIVHIYNAVAPLWRELVFQMTVPQVMTLVRESVALARRLTDARPSTDWTLQYSPETFSLAELEVSLEACETAIEAWGASRPIILNLPTTVESATPNVFADQVEWMRRRLARHANIILSVHPHNDRGTGTAAAEFALMAGADRLEGCLFGNGERTGNLDLVNVALNLYTQGVDPCLDFSDIDRVKRTVEQCNRLPVPPRHPYAGDLVYTSFSGTHQDAIKKAFALRRDADFWAIPYLPIDPRDLGRTYEAVIRVNSQSGKGGMAYLLATEFGLELPRRLQIEFSRVVQAAMDAQGTEFSAADIFAIFEREYGLRSTPSPRDCRMRQVEDGGQVQLSAQVLIEEDEPITVEGCGNGPVDAFVDGFARGCGEAIRVLSFHEHAIGHGSRAQAVAYLELCVGEEVLYGVGQDSDIVSASLKAIVSGVKRARARGQTSQASGAASPA